MFLVGFAAGYVGSGAHELDVFFACDALVYVFQVLGYLDGIFGKFLVVAFMNALFPQVDGGDQKDFHIWRVGSDLVKKTGDAFSDYLCGGAENSFAVVGAQHEDHCVYAVIGF